MNEQNKKMELLGSAPIPKALLTLGLPTMVGMLINALYNLVDTYFVGGLGTDQMGAITVAYPLGQVVVGLGLLFGNGAAAYLSRLLGRGDKETANKVASTALYSSVFSGAIVIVCSVIFLKPILKQLGAIDSVMPYALAYTSIYIIFSIFNVFNVTMNNIVSSEGAAKTAMCALMAGAVLNVVLDPVCIYSLGLGVAGAAVATAVSQFVSTLVYLCYIFWKKSMFCFHIKECCYTKEIISEILKIGIPTLIFQLLTSLSVAMVNDAATEYGRLREAIRISVIWSTVFCVVFGLSVVIFSTGIMAQFTKNDMEMIHIGQTALRANGISFMAFGFHTVYSFLFLVMGKAKEGCILGACRQGICFVPVILVLPGILGLNGVLYTQPAADVFAAAVTVVMALKLRGELKGE